MNAPGLKGSSASRMIITFIGFVACLCLLAFLVVKHLTKPKQPSEFTSDMRDNAGESTFFYQTIGRAPASFHMDEGEKPASPKVSYTLEIKVAKSQEEAEKIIDMLHNMGIEAYYTPLTRAGKVVFRVRRGIFSNRKLAQKAALALKQGKQIAAKVTKLQ